MSKEKTYLKWYNKVGYGSGDVAGNVVYALLTSFVMIYLTDTIGMNAGIVGTLIAVSKIFDGMANRSMSTPFTLGKVKSISARRLSRKKIIRSAAISDILIWTML